MKWLISKKRRVALLLAVATALAVLNPELGEPLLDALNGALLDGVPPAL